MAERPESTAARAASQEASGPSKVSSRIGVRVNSMNCASSLPTRPLVNRDGDWPSIGT